MKLKIIGHCFTWHCDTKSLSETESDPDLIVIYKTTAISDVLSGLISLDRVHWMYQFSARVINYVAGQSGVHRWFRI